MCPIARLYRPQQPLYYCMHCLHDIDGKPIVMQETVSFPDLPNVHAIRYLHEECALQLEREAREE